MIPRNWFLAFLYVILTMLPQFVAADTIECDASFITDDAYVNSYYIDNVHNAGSLIIGYHPDVICRTYIKFDISQCIPDEATIISATLTMRPSSGPGSHDPLQINVYMSTVV